MKKFILAGMMLLAVAVLSGCSRPDFSKFLGGKTVNPEQARTIAEDFVNNNLLSNGTKATIKEIVEENGLYKITLGVNDQEIVTYLTKDGKTFFPQALDIAEVKNRKNDQNSDSDTTVAPTEAATKVDVPEVKLFVMSYCPYGTQAERGILPALSVLGSKINFNLEFVNYAMHGEKEVDENLRQYCIEKSQPEKLEIYLKCFLEAGNSESCLSSSGINSAQLDSCVKDTDTKFGIKKSFNDKSTWQGGQFPPFDTNKDDNITYAVKGSPTLVINGAQVSPEGRDPKSFLKAICSGFNNPPKECQQDLSSEAPAVGFDSSESTSNSSGGSCGS